MVTYGDDDENGDDDADDGDDDDDDDDNGFEVHVHVQAGHVQTSVRPCYLMSFNCLGDMSFL